MRRDRRRPVPVREACSSPDATAVRARRLDSDAVVLGLLALATAVLLVVVTAPSAFARSRSAGASIGVDPNSAPWWELATLPRVGPAIAHEMIEYRSAARRSRGIGATEPVFHRPYDLTGVRGIGPGILRRIGPHLRFPPEAVRPKRTRVSAPRGAAQLPTTGANQRESRTL